MEFGLTPKNAIFAMRFRSMGFRLLSGLSGTVCWVAVSFLIFHGLLAQTVVIYHTSDVHGWYTARRVSGPGNTSRQVGGYAALSALVKKEAHPYILLDSGDLYQGTPEGNFSK